MVRFGNDIDGIELEPGQSIKDQNGNEVLRVTEDGAVVNSSEVSTDSLRTEGLSIGGWEWVDAVQQGIDNTGQSDISADLADLGADNRLLVLPSGTYHFDNGVTFEGVSKFGVMAAGDVTITVADDIGAGALTFGTPSNPADDVYVSGLRYDFSAEGNGDMPLRVVASSRFLVEDVKVNGQIDNNGSTPDGAMRTAGRFALRDSDAMGEVRNYRVPDGGIDTLNDGSEARLHGVVVAGGQSTGGTIGPSDLQVTRRSIWMDRTEDLCS